MDQPSLRHTPLVVVASAQATLADELTQRLRSTGLVAYATHSVEGCLRVATSVGPDIVLLDPALPARLERLLRAHPVSAGAKLLHLADWDASRAGPNLLRPASAA